MNGRAKALIVVAVLFTVAGDYALKLYGDGRATRHLVACLTLCESLCKLNLSHCRRVTDVAALAQCTSLQVLNLSHCAGLDDVTGLARSTSLQVLYVYGRTTESPPLRGVAVVCVQIDANRRRLHQHGCHTRGWHW